MWNLFNCYLSGRHDYGMWCEPGAIFLRCIHCGKRSSGWAVTPKPAVAVQRRAGRRRRCVAPRRVARKTRVLPFAPRRRHADSGQVDTARTRDHNTESCRFPASPKKI